MIGYIPSWDMAPFKDNIYFVPGWFREKKKKNTNKWVERILITE